MFWWWTVFPLATRAISLGEDEVPDKRDLWVAECQIANFAQQAFLQQLVLTGDYDLWEEAVPAAPAEVTLLLNTPQLSHVQSSISCEHVIELDLYEWILQKSCNTTAHAKTTDFFSDYRSYAEIQARLQGYRSNKVVQKLGSIGKSVEGRELPVIHLSSGANKKLIWVSGGQHAREWIAPASIMYVINALITGYGIDASITRLLDSFEVALAPTINPDGYEYSRSRFRYWRKNRRRNGDGSFGVDLNRNWDIHWCELGSSRSPNSDIYCGSKAASEPEVYLTQAYIKGLTNRVAGLDIHSFGQMVLRNPGWSSTPTPQEPRLRSLGDAMSTAMNALFNNDYSSDLSSGLYPTGGSMDDWMFYGAGMPGFTIELRDHGQYGFLLPADQIVPTGQEVLAALLALSQTL